MSLIKAKISYPTALINIKPLEKMRFMAATAEGLRIGALARIDEIEHSELILRNLPMLAEAAGYVGAPHIRRMATLAGNLCQQTRCWYYRRTADTGISFTCHRKGEPGVCHAKGGENQYHAVTGHQTCASSFPSDLAVALAAMDASVRIANPDGGRSIPISEMYDDQGTILSKDEIVTSLFVPEQGADVRRKFMKFRVRKTIDFAIVSAAVSYKVVDGLVEDARIFLGGVRARALPRPEGGRNDDRRGRLARAGRKAGRGSRGRHAAPGQERPQAALDRDHGETSDIGKLNKFAAGRLLPLKRGRGQGRG